MYVDKLLQFSSAQAITAAAASTDYIDLGSVRNIGDGEDLYLVSVVTTAFTDASSNSTLSVSLYGDSTTTFTPDGSDVVFTIPALAAIGDTFAAKLSPSHAALGYRYVQAYYTPNNGDLSTGAVTTFITKDISKYRAYADNITITG
jgi:hypothetical protein